MSFLERLRSRRNLRNYETLGYITDDDWFGGASAPSVRINTDGTWPPRPETAEPVVWSTAPPLERFGPELDADTRRIIGEAIARASEEDA